MVYVCNDRVWRRFELRRRAQISPKHVDLENDGHLKVKQVHTGGGHPFQTASYLLGYTGNMARGIMFDWSSVTLESKIDTHHGLVRGFELYTEALVMMHGEDGELGLEEGRDPKKPNE